MKQESLRNSGSVPTSLDDALKEQEGRRVYEYWFNFIKKCKKQMPLKEWEKAEKMLRAGDKDEEIPYDNGYRHQYEALKSFLDQNDPSFRVTPTDAFMSDPNVAQFAKCDAAYLKYIWPEQECQIAESQKLDSALQRNAGFTLVGFDKKKWMPNIKYIPAKNVGIDPDCNGQLEKANAKVFWEEISIEELKAKHPGLTEEELEEIKRNGGSMLDEDEQRKLDTDEEELYTTVTFYHVFARNDAAIRRTAAESEDVLPEQSLLDELNLETPRRYLQFVKGYHKPLMDVEKWPYDLDDNEFPLTMLRFNTPTGQLYGFTDHKQMQRLDGMCNNIFRDMEKAAYWAGNKKFGGTPDAIELSDIDINAFLNDPTKTYLPKILDSTGNMKIQEIKMGEFDGDLVQAYKIAEEARRKASMLGELMSEEVKEYKDVTAVGVKVREANVHQKINRRLGGPEGYEKSLAEDAIKLLEIAHQRVPKLSVIEVKVPEVGIDEMGRFYETGEERYDYLDLPWEQAQRLLIQPNAKLIKLGVDAIVGAELAPYWRTTEEYPIRLFKLTTQVAVLPGSTRSITKEHKAAILKQYLLEVFAPMYQAMNRWDLYAQFALRIGQLADIKKIDDLVPDSASIQQFMAEQQELARMQASLEAEKQVADIESQREQPANKEQ